MTRFFIPPLAATSPVDPDEAYAELARFAGRPVPPKNQRIASIVFLHDVETWTATVGHPLSGTHLRQRTRRGRRVEIEQRLRDNATVLAIFAGHPYMVVTDARPLGTVVSEWINPFMAEAPQQVVMFDTP